MNIKNGIGLLGCGAIGQGLALAVDSGVIKGARLVAVFDQDSQKSNSLVQRLNGSTKTADSFEDFIDSEGLSLVVEAASQEAVRKYGKAVIDHSKHLMIMSTGALLDKNLFSEMSHLAQVTGLRIFVPSGAVGGIDAIRASRHELHEVTLTTRKPPESLADTDAGSLESLKKLDSATVVFEGNALEAVQRFPFNINVAATISLAGIGPEKTRVRIIADPNALGNIHEIYAAGRSGVMTFVMENVPHPDNPRTSHLAVLSAIEALRTVCEDGIRIGA